MELPGSHVLWKKSNCPLIIVEPVVAEDTVLGSHLLKKLGPGHGGQDQDKGGLEAVFHGKLDNLIEDLGSVLVKSYHKGAHHADFSLVKTPDTIGVLSRFIGELVHLIHVRLRERFEANVHSDTS